MKLLVKTLKNKSYEIEVENEKLSIKLLKDMVRSQLDLKTNNLKLLYNGIILEDKYSLEHYKIYENSVIIAAAIGSVKKNEGEENVASEEVKKNQVNDIPKKIEGAGKYEIYDKYSEQLETLSEMGFDQSKCLNAIIAANGSIPIAIEYLYNGIPPNLGGIHQQEIVDNGVDEQHSLNNDEDAESQHNLEIQQILSPEILDSINLSDPNSLSIIASVIKVMLSQSESSELIQDIFEYIKEENPEIIEFISSRKNEFDQLLAQPLSSADLNVYNNIIGMNGLGSMAVPQNEDEDENSILNELTKDFTDKDNNCISNIVSLGFNEAEAIEAYLACEKNEENAVDFLFQGKQ